VAANIIDNTIITDRIKKMICIMRVDLDIELVSLGWY